VAWRANVEQIVQRIEEAKALDPVADQEAGAVNAATAPAPVKNAVTGAWLLRGVPEARQPAYQVRQVDDQVQVRAAS